MFRYLSVRLAKCQRFHEIGESAAEGGTAVAVGDRCSGIQYSHVLTVVVVRAVVVVVAVALAARLDSR